MARQRVTVLQLADATKIPSSRLHRRFNGSTPLNSDELARIAAYLRVPASELVRRAEAAA